eukprot:250581-Prymnesium_polylepis.1
MDGSYDSRFWPLMEAWGSMMRSTPKRVRAAKADERRYTIACIHNALTEYDKPKLVAKLSTKTPQEMHDMLAKPDVVLTNYKDKELMLPIVRKTNEFVVEILTSKPLPPHLTLREGSSHSDLVRSAPAVLQRFASAPLVEYPNLPFDAYREQRAFHHIDLAYPGLQLVNESPYIFIVRDFLNASEFQALIALLAIAPNVNPSADSASQAKLRTSSTLVPMSSDVTWFRERITKLAS